MGSHNSENSGSVDSDEFAAFIGHNYAGLVLNPPPQVHFELDNGSFSSDEVMGEPLSPWTQQRMREQIQLILDNGSVRNASGPAVGITP